MMNKCWNCNAKIKNEGTLRRASSPLPKPAVRIPDQWNIDSNAVYYLLCNKCAGELPRGDSMTSMVCKRCEKPMDEGEEINLTPFAASKFGFLVSCQRCYAEGRIVLIAEALIGLRSIPEVSFLSFLKFYRRFKRSIDPNYLESVLARAPKIYEELRGGFTGCRQLRLMDRLVDVVINRISELTQKEEKCHE